VVGRETRKEGWKEGGREGRREVGREGRQEGVKEGGRKRRKEGRKEGGKEGRMGGRERKMEFHEKVIFSSSMEICGKSCDIYGYVLLCIKTI
jgi:hypothetical protein